MLVAVKVSSPFVARVAGVVVDARRIRRPDASSDIRVVNVCEPTAAAGAVWK